MSWLVTFGVYFYIFVLVCIGLIGAAVAGCAMWVGVNRLIDRYQQSHRRMATPMSARELHEKRQNDAAARRLQIRIIDGWARK